MCLPLERPAAQAHAAQRHQLPLAIDDARAVAPRSRRGGAADTTDMSAAARAGAPISSTWSSKDLHAADHTVHHRTRTNRTLRIESRRSACSGRRSDPRAPRCPRRAGTGCPQSRLRRSSGLSGGARATARTEQLRRVATVVPVHKPQRVHEPEDFHRPARASPNDHARCPRRPSRRRRVARPASACDGGRGSGHGPRRDARQRVSAIARALRRCHGIRSAEPHTAQRQVRLGQTRHRAPLRCLPEPRQRLPAGADDDPARRVAVAADVLVVLSTTEFGPSSIGIHQARRGGGGVTMVGAPARRAIPRHRDIRHTTAAVRIVSMNTARGRAMRSARRMRPDRSRARSASRCRAAPARRGDGAWVAPSMYLASTQAITTAHARGEDPASSAASAGRTRMAPTPHSRRVIVCSSASRSDSRRAGG